MRISDGSSDVCSSDRAVVEILPRIRVDGEGVGKLLMQMHERLLARDLGRQQTLRQVGNLVLGKQPGPFRHPCSQVMLQVLDAVAGERRDHERGPEPARLVERLRKREQAVPANRVDLVADQRRALPELGEPLERWEENTSELQSQIRISYAGL